MSKSENRKDLIRCPICNRPMAKRRGNSLFHVQYRNREVIETETEILPTSDVTQFRIKCSDKECPGSAIYIMIKDSMSLGDSVEKNIE